MSSSGWRTYGTIFSAGCRVQAETPASASDALISLRNVRRATGSATDSLVGSNDGNSLYKCSWNDGSFARSSSVRQNVRCWDSGFGIWDSLGRAESDDANPAESDDTNPAESDDANPAESDDANPESRIPNPESRLSLAESDDTNPAESDDANPVESRIPNPESRLSLSLIGGTWSSS